jgi:hypothetical protein
MSYVNAVTSHFSSYFTTSQVVQRTIHTNTANWAHATMIVNVRSGVADTCYDVHPLALWILCAAFKHVEETSKPDKALSYYHQNNACASFGSYGTGTPLSRAFYQARRCMYDTREGCGNFRDADPMTNALAELNGWVPTEKELIALRRGNWSWGFDFARFCPDLPPHDGWSGKAGGML